MQEVDFSSLKHPLLCPIKFWLPGGFLVVMPNVRILTRKLTTRQLKGFTKDNLPVENKPSSFGYLEKGNLVAVDYGS